MDHWRRGHKQICKEIHRGGNAEQYNEDKKYREAFAVAVKACAADTKGQTCYICIVQGNLANTHFALRRIDTAIQIERDIYSGYLKLLGEENRTTLTVAGNHANSLTSVRRFEEAKLLLRKAIPTVRRILGENDIDTLKMRVIYAQSLYMDDGAALNDLREAVSTFEELERTTRRVLGGAHPLTKMIEGALPEARTVLRARKTPPGS